VEGEAGEVKFCEVGVESLSEIGAVNGSAMFLFGPEHEGGGEAVGVEEEGAEFVGEGDGAAFAILGHEGGGGVDVDEAEGEIKPRRDGFDDFEFAHAGVQGAVEDEF